MAETGDFYMAVDKDGRVLVLGGADPLGHALQSAELFDPNTSTFSSAGSMRVPRYGPGVALLTDGRVLVVGGSTELGVGQPSAEIYDPTTNTFSPA
jgi:hypothetical protein